MSANSSLVIWNQIGDVLQCGSEYIKTSAGFKFSFSGYDQNKTGPEYGPVKVVNVMQEGKESNFASL